MSQEFVMPGKIISGENALENAKEIFANAGKKALIVSGKVMEKVGNVAKVASVLESAGVEYAIFTDIIGEPTDEMIQQGVEVYKKEQCDFLVGIGGGSPLDSIKAIAIQLDNPGKLSDYMGQTLTMDTPPMIAIPTTAGTGSEATWFTVITDTENNVKMLLKGPAVMPDVAILDYTFTMSSPQSVTSATGLDALTHAVEGYTSKKAQPLTDVFAISAIKRIFKYLPIAYTDGNNEEAREQMALAALEAGIVITNSSVTVVHGMSRPIGALFHVPHGISNAMLIKDCLEYVIDGALERFAVLGREIGVAEAEDSDEAAAKSFIAALDQLCKCCEVPTLEQYGIDKKEFFDVMDKMATDALISGSPGNTRKELEKEDLLNIYHTLWD